mgnify:CR=1 FL=1
MRNLLRAASSAVCDERRSFCAWIRVAWALLIILQRNGLALEQVLGALVLRSAPDRAPTCALFMAGHRAR